MIVFFQHLPKASGGREITLLLELVGQESRVVSNFINIETQSAIYDTKKLVHETFIFFHETIMPVFETLVNTNYDRNLMRRRSRLIPTNLAIGRPASRSCPPGKIEFLRWPGLDFLVVSEVAE